MTRSRQGKRVGHMVMGSMSDISITRKRTEQEIENFRHNCRVENLGYFKKCREVIFLQDHEQVMWFLFEGWPYGSHDPRRLRLMGLYKRIKEKAGK